MKKWKLWLTGIYDGGLTKKQHLLVTGSARLDIAKKIGDSSAPQKEKVSGAGQYNEKDQSVQVYQIMLDSWQDGRDWISHLRPFSH